MTKMKADTNFGVYDSSGMVLLLKVFMAFVLKNADDQIDKYDGHICFLAKMKMYQT